MSTEEDARKAKAARIREQIEELTSKPTGPTPSRRARHPAGRESSRFHPAEDGRDDPPEAARHGLSGGGQGHSSP